GGEARPLTDLPRGATAPMWSPDGRTIAFSASATADDFRKAQEGREKQEGPEKGTSEHKTDVKVITRAVYRANGNPNFLEPDRHTHIWTARVSDDSGADAGSIARRGLTAAAESKPITSGEFDERAVEWAPDGSKIYFISTRVAEPYYEPQHSELYSVPAAGGSITKVASIEGTINDAALSRDGRRLAFVGALHGNPVRSYSQPDLWVSDATPGSTPRNLTAAY